MDTLSEAELARRLDVAAGYLLAADSLLITAGAGMGVDSGLPDYRGSNGLWNDAPDGSRPAYRDIARGLTFREDPELAWTFYGPRLLQYRQATPHAGFGILLELARSRPGGYFVFTSNVDGQFQQAGFPQRAIVECHGSLHYLQCIKRCHHDIWSAAASAPDQPGWPPVCPHCGGPARPNVQMFEDYDWISDRTDEQRDLLFQWAATVRKPLVMEFGAGTVISNVRFASEHLFGPPEEAWLIRVNPFEFAVPNARSIGLPMSALDALTALWKRVRQG